MTDTPETMTRSEFARHMNWSPSYVTKLAGAGRLVFTEDNKRIKVAESLARHEATKDPARDDVQARNAAQRGAPPETGAPSLTDLPPDLPDGRGTNAFQEARAKREHYAAETAQREYEKLIGNLVESSSVHSGAAHVASIIRGQLENWPALLAHELAPINDEVRIQALLVEHVENLLTQIADMIATSAGSSAR